jgi:hypothetical protein
MRDAGTGLQRAEEIDRMVRRVAEEQRDGVGLAAAGAQEGSRGTLRHGGERGIADRAIAEFQRGARAEIGGGFRQEVRQRALDDGVVPTHALGIKLFAGMGHFLDCLSEQLTSTVIPGRDKVASPESITTSWGYGFRACALRRIPE